MSLSFEEGFAPFYSAESKLLILGSFPSVKSRAVGFYYGNPQNRFWKTVCGFFGEEVPLSVSDKQSFLSRKKIALWDVVLSCEIEGSADASIQNEVVADVPSLLKNSNIKAIFCNGSKAYSLFSEKFPKLLPMAKKLSSTSPANPRFQAEEWHSALRGVFQE